VISRRSLFTQFRYGTYAAPVPAALVVPAAGQPDAGERHVADRQVERPIGDTGVGEGLVAMSESG
jgi:hypothetical protein